MMSCLRVVNRPVAHATPAIFCIDAFHLERFTSNENLPVASILASKMLNNLIHCDVG